MNSATPSHRPAHANSILSLSLCLREVSTRNKQLETMGANRKARYPDMAVKQVLPPERTGQGLGPRL